MLTTMACKATPLPVADFLACPECGGAIDPGPLAWRCRGCERRWPATLGIPDFRPNSDGQATAEVERLVELFERARFDELVAQRTPNFSTNDERLRKIYAAYRSKMNERGGVFYRMVRARLAELLPPCGSDLALAVGCGAGASMLELVKAFRHVVGIDPNLADLILAKKALEERGLADKVTLLQGYVQATPLASRSVDFAIAEDVLEHVMDLDGTFEELARVLAPGGIFAGNSVNRFNVLRPEPHVRLWFVGFLPRSWQAPYVEWRRQFFGYDRMCRLPSYRELARAIRAHFGKSGRIVFPGVEPYGLPPALDRVLRGLERLGPLAVPLLWGFPSHLAIARVPGEPRPRRSDQAGETVASSALSRV